MSSSTPRDVITLRDVITVLVLVNSVTTHAPDVTSSGVNIRKGAHGETYFLHRYTDIDYLGKEENEQVIIN